MNNDTLTRQLNVLEQGTKDLNAYIQAQADLYPALKWGTRYHINSRSERMDFRDSFFLVDLYKIIDDTPRMVVQKSVQCGLSELFIIQSHIEAGERGLSVMYVLPKYEIRNRFVNNRIYRLHKKADYYKLKVLEAATSVHRTSLMHFGKGTLVYVGSNVADEFIEVPVDSAYVDEKDRCNQTNLLMLPDRYSASQYQYHREIANPTVDKYGINARYRASSQGLWTLTCEHCGHEFTPDFFKHVVREVAESTFEIIDPVFDLERYKKRDFSTDVRLICDKCSKPVDRLQRGRWVHAYPNREWQGFIVSKLFSKFNSLHELVEKWEEGKTNELKKQVFYNSDLGLTFSGKGNKLTEGLISECAEQYTYPVKQVNSSDTLLMGVDVGNMLNYVIRRRVKEEGRIRLQQVDAGAVPSFSAIAGIIRRWKPKRVIVDSQPEIHKVMELKAEFPNRVFAARFADGVTALTFNKKRKEYSLDRTAVLDYVLEAFTTREYIIPGNFRDIEGGTYKAQMLASTRLLDINEENLEKSKFKWIHTEPDHFFLAEGYLYMAHLSLPIHDMFDFFEKEQQSQDKLAAYKKAKYADPKDRDTIAAAMELTPELFLASIKDADARKRDTLVPKVDEREIRRCIELMYDTQGYVDIQACVSACKEHEEDVRRWLRRMGFSESALKGQYIK